MQKKKLKIILKEIQYLFYYSYWNISIPNLREELESEKKKPYLSRKFLWVMKSIYLLYRPSNDVKQLPRTKRNTTYINNGCMTIFLVLSEISKKKFFSFIFCSIKSFSNDFSCIGNNIFPNRLFFFSQKYSRILSLPHFRVHLIMLKFSN